MSAPDFTQLSERFNVRESVLENLYEEYNLEVEAFGLDYEFEDYLIEEFAQASFILTAVEGGDVVECLEAYDDTYVSLANDD